MILSPYRKCAIQHEAAPIANSGRASIKIAGEGQRAQCFA
jgi:hypothetical protein